MNKLKIIFIFISCFLFSGKIFSINPESTNVSLLTCSPGSQIYAIFGHTAIRIEDPSTDEDIVFNYGVFDFNTPNFVWRFVKGETDYKLGISPFEYFEIEYARRGSYVVQQTLDLLPEEKLRLWNILNINYRPENRVYRYNYFFDNCTTRARDKIEECLVGELNYAEDNRPFSYRDIIHQYTKNDKWAEFGIDFCLGSKADKSADYRQKMFAPFYLLEQIEEGKIVRNGEERKIILSTEIIVDGREGYEKDVQSFVTPLTVNWSLFVLVLIVSIIGFRMNKTFWGVDLILFGIAGIAGCIIAFLVFFSVHAAVSPNYLLFFLHPIHLFYLPVLIYHEIKRKKEWYHLINLIVLTIFIALWGVLPQSFNPAVLPLALCLLIRSVSYLLLSYKINK